MPLTKSSDGTFLGILSDTSIDRDGEFMTKELLTKWAGSDAPLPALANHENKMEKWIGGWTDKRVITKNGHSALVAKPFFFSKEANPLAAQIKKQVEEALEIGLNAGISIGAIPKNSIEKEVDGKIHTAYTDAELVEATFVPVQSNRNANYGHIAKQFDLEDQADAICNEKQTDMEVTKMSEELIEKQEDAPEPVAEPSSEPVVEKPTEPEVVDEVEETPELEEKKADVELVKAKEELESLKKEIEKVKKHAILKGTVEGPIQHKEESVEVPVTVENMLSKVYGGK